jgi:hypothetical protein
MAGSIGLGWDRNNRDQYAPVAPKTFPRGNSHMPAMNCRRPPVKMAMPTTTLGWLMWRVPRLNRESMKVVDAKENIPLCTRKKLNIHGAQPQVRGNCNEVGKVAHAGAGFAMRVGLTCRRGAVASTDSLCSTSLRCFSLDIVYQVGCCRIMVVRQRSLIVSVNRIEA